MKPQSYDHVVFSSNNLGYEIKFKIPFFESYIQPLKSYFITTVKNS